MATMMKEPATDGALGRYALGHFDLKLECVDDPEICIQEAAAHYPHLPAAAFVHDLIVFHDFIPIGPKERMVCVFQPHFILTSLEVGA